MYSLHLTCQPEEMEDISVALWEAGTEGIREEDRTLIAAFDDSADRAAIARQFSQYETRWEQEETTDWVRATEQAWPAREVGGKLFLTPVWDRTATPAGRIRVVHNPGMASGTGEHPCTQLALAALELCVAAGQMVVDVGAGSGLLSVAAMILGAGTAIALDPVFDSLATARENFQLNQLLPTLVAGSADCLASEISDIVVANISGSVLVAIADDLFRILKPAGRMILTGFPESELAAMERMFGVGEVSEMNEWRCLSLTA